eukprot:g21688.t1
MFPLYGSHDVEVPVLDWGRQSQKSHDTRLQSKSHKFSEHCSFVSVQDNIGHNTTKPCHGNLCKTCQIIDMDITITCGNTMYHVHA